MMRLHPNLNWNYSSNSRCNECNKKYGINTVSIHSKLLLMSYFVTTQIIVVMVITTNVATT